MLSPTIEISRRPPAATSSAAAGCGPVVAGGASTAPGRRCARWRTSSSTRSSSSPAAHMTSPSTAASSTTRLDDWATLTYERREFFEWGGWLAVRPMDELPYFRVLMRREREQAAGSKPSRDRPRRCHRRDARHPATGARSATATSRWATATRIDQLPRAQGQRPGPPLPVADRRSDGHPARAVRTGLRPDRGGRAGHGPARESTRPRRTTSWRSRPSPPRA